MARGRDEQVIGRVGNQPTADSAFFSFASVRRCTLICCFLVFGCSHTGKPVALASEAPDSFSLRLLVDASEADAEIKAVLDSRGMPEALQILDENSEILRAVLFYPNSDDKYVLLRSGTTDYQWAMDGPFQIEWQEYKRVANAIGKFDNLIPKHSE